MSLRMNLNDYIDDQAEASSFSSSNFSSKGSLSDEEEQSISSPIKSNPQTLHIQTAKKNRSLFTQKALEEDDKQIEEIISRAFNRSKREDDSDAETSVIIQPQQPQLTSSTQLQPVVHKFRIGFKRNAAQQSNASPARDEADPQLSPSQELFDSLKYCHDKRLSQQLNENSTEQKTKLNQRLKEDENILLNVVKLNKPNQLSNNNPFKPKPNANVLFTQRISTKGNSMLSLVKQDKEEKDANAVKETPHPRIFRQRNNFFGC